MTRRIAPAPAPAGKTVPAERGSVAGYLAIFVATFLAYIPALKATFIWNDADYVTAPELRTGQGLARIWFELGATEQYYPFLHSAFWVQHKLWGDNPAGYHVFNVLVHAGCACLLVHALRRLAIPGAVLAGFIFALHPVYVESVAWISEQKNTLSLLFYLLAAIAYLRFDAGRRSRDYAIATVLFVIALLTKSVTAVLPPALLVVFWWRNGRLEWRRDVRPLLPWFVLGAAMGLVSAYVEKEYIGAKGSEFELSLLQRSLLAGRVIWFYLGKLVWPADLIFIYPRWRVDAAEPWQWVFSLAVLATLAALWVGRRRLRSPLAAALFFGGSLFPVLGFFNVYAFMYSFVADHWQYLPSLGVVVLFAAGLSLGLARARPPLRRTVPTVLVAALAVLTFHQSRMYADMRTFYRTTLERNPTAWMAHNNLGNLLREDGRLEEAIAHFESALRVRPDLVKVHNNLGNCLRDRKRIEEAIASYRRAIALDSNYAEGHNNLGRTLREAGSPGESITVLLRAMRLDPGNPDVRNNLGMALREAGRHQDAIVQFQRAVRLDPNYSAAHLNLALSFSILGRDPEAVEHYREARRLNPKIPALPGM